MSFTDVVNCLVMMVRWLKSHSFAATQHQIRLLCGHQMLPFLMWIVDGTSCSFLPALFSDVHSRHTPDVHLLISRMNSSSRMTSNRESCLECVTNWKMGNVCLFCKRKIVGSSWGKEYEQQLIIQRCRQFVSCRHKPVASKIVERRRNVSIIFILISIAVSLSLKSFWSVFLLDDDDASSSFRYFRSNDFLLFSVDQLFTVGRKRVLKTVWDRIKKWNISPFLWKSRQEISPSVLSHLILSTLREERSTCFKYWFFTKAVKSYSFSVVMQPFSLSPSTSLWLFGG